MNTEKQNPGLKFAYFVFGIAVPIAGYMIWCKSMGPRCNRREQIDQAHDITVEDSFPASDPPSAW